jgi:hypothetical protein
MPPLRRHSLACAAVICVFTTFALGADRKSRVFHAGYEQVWTAGVEVAKEAFYQVDTTKQEGKLRFRTRPYGGYRFRVSFIDLGGGKTNIQMELRANYNAVDHQDRDGWRHGRRYLKLLGNKVQQSVEK